MTDKFQPLRDALAAGPTPGPWFHGAKNGEHKYCVYDKVCWTDADGRHGETPNMVVHVSPDDGKFHDAAYIAAADPNTIRDLLAERDRLREALRWTAAVLNDAAASAYSLDEDALIKMGDETRTVSQILDAADAALAQEQGESDANRDR